MADLYKVFTANVYWEEQVKCRVDPWNDTDDLVNIRACLAGRTASEKKTALRRGGTVVDEDFPRRGYC